MAVPTITARMISRDLSEERVLIEWLMNVGVIADRRVCGICEGNMKLNKRKNGVNKFMWRCKKRGEGKHDVNMSVRKSSWFESSHLSMNDILLITHMWCMEVSHSYIKNELNVAKQSVTDWMSLCREVCVQLCERDNEMLGGEGKIVEIDESKFGKRKYQRGRRMEGKWVFGGIERGTNRCFMQIVEERSKIDLHGVKVIFNAAEKISGHLPKSAKTNKPLENPGIYSIPCKCGKTYIGQTGRHINTRLNEHKADVRKDLRERSAVAEHAALPGHTIQFDETKMMARNNRFWPRIYREAIEIYKTPTNYNRDNGIYLPTTWKPLFRNVNPKTTAPYIRRNNPD